jgi:hypothetical protein
MSKIAFLPCPLCGNDNALSFHHDKFREYVQCGTCDLVFVPKAFHLSAEAEKKYYDLHENHPDDPGYRAFLSKLFGPLNQHLSPKSHGLDFGCGPGPALPKLFEEAGHSMALHDPYYAPDRAVLSNSYDFITMSEVVEHLAEPGKVLDDLWANLNPGSWLGIMTKRVRNAEAFKTWHYITDPTHICYFSVSTFQWLAKRWSAKLIISGDDVVLMQKGFRC